MASGKELRRRETVVRKSNSGIGNWKMRHRNYWGRGLVMVEDEIIRNNRLALLDGIGQPFLRIADFSKLT